MADRWVIAAGGNSNASATWATTEANAAANAGGAGVPTSADDIKLSSVSGQLTVNAALVCRSFDCNHSGMLGPYAGVLTHNASVTIGVGDGRIRLSSGMTYTRGSTTTSQWNCTATTDNGGAGWQITTAGKTLSNIFFDGVGGKWQLQDALTSSATITLTRGHLDTNSQTVTASSAFSSSNSNVRTLTLGSSSVTVTAGGNAWLATTTTNLTVTANTATVTLSGAAVTFATGSGFDWNGLSLAFSGSGTSAISNTCTLGNLTRTGTAAKTDALTMQTVTITGTFTANGNSTINRILVQSNTLGVAKTITASTVVASNVDFSDITGAGAANWDLSAITGGSGDAGGNSGITFTTAVTRYAVVAGNWSNTATWSTTSGGAGGASVPLPQDDVRLDASSAAGTYTIDMPRVGKSIDLTGFTRSINSSVVFSVYGSWIFGSAGTNSLNNTMTLAGRGTHTLASGGKTFAISLTFSPVAGSYTLQDALTSNRDSTTAIITNSGTLDFNAQSVTLTGTSGAVNHAGGTIVATGSTITLPGSQGVTAAGTAPAIVGGTWILTTTAGPSTPWSMIGTSVISGAPNITFAGVSNGARTFDGEGKTYGTLTYTVADSPGTLIITGSNTFDELNVGAGRTLQITTGTTQNVGTWNVNGEVRDYVQMPGLATAYIWTPDHADLDITGDIDLRAHVMLTDWSPSVSASCIAKWGATTATESYILRVNTSGSLRLQWVETGPTLRTADSTATTGFTNGTDHWVAATLDVDNGGGSRVIKFWTYNGTTPPADVTTWTQLGATITTAGTTSIINSTTQVALGSESDGSTSLLVGRMYKAEIRNGINGTLVGDFDASAQVTGSDTYTDSAGKVWTLNGLARQGDGRVTINSSSATNAIVSQSMVETTGKVLSFFGDAHTRSGYLAVDGTGDYATSPDHADLDITGDIDLIVSARLTDWTPATAGTLVAKRAASASGVSFSFVVNTNGTFDLRLSSDGAAGTAVASSIASGVTDNTDKWVRATWRNSDDRVQFFLSDDGVAWTQLGTDRTLAVTGIADTTSALEIGAQQGGSTNFLNGRIYRVIVKDGIDGTTVFDADFAAYNRAQNFSSYLQLSDVTAIGNADWFASLSTSSDSPNWNVSSGMYAPGALVTETDAGLAGAPTMMVLGSLVTVTSSALSGSILAAIAGALATELDDAQAGAVAGGGPTIVDGALATELDDAQAGTAAASVAGAQSTSAETTSAGTISATTTGAVAASIESTLAGAPAVTAIGAVATSTEAVSAGSASAHTAGTTATSTSSPLIGKSMGEISGSQSSSASSSGDGDAAAAVAGVSVVETDAVLSGTNAASVTGAQSPEIDAAGAGGPSLTVDGAESLETDVSSAGGAAGSVAGARGLETDTSLAGVSRGVVDGAQSVEVDTSAAGDLDFAALGALATEVDAIFAGSVDAEIFGALATELDDAQAGAVAVPFSAGRSIVGVLERDPRAGVIARPPVVGVVRDSRSTVGVRRVDE